MPALTLRQRDNTGEHPSVDDDSDDDSCVSSDRVRLPVCVCCVCTMLCILCMCVCLVVPCVRMCVSGSVVYVCTLFCLMCVYVCMCVPCFVSCVLRDKKTTVHGYPVGASGRGGELHRGGKERRPNGRGRSADDRH